jgi:carbonic anhydrase/acetyltransferase-like protein (isoleucine patch superfamily)
MTPSFTRTVENAFLASTAVVVGDVTIGEGASFWFGAVVPMRIGRRVNVQDNAVIHCDSGVENAIEDDVTIGHSAIVHGAYVGEGTLIGMGAKVLGQTRIGRRCLIAAGAVVPPGLVVPDDHCVMGVPGKIVRPVRAEEKTYMQRLTSHYVRLAERYAAGEFIRR